MNPTIDELQDANRFELIAIIPHEPVAMAAAIRKHLWNWSVPLIVYLIANGLALLWVVWVWYQSGKNLIAGFPIFSLGIVSGYLLILPVHESLHAAAYRWIALADSVHIRYDFRYLTAACLADRVVVSQRPFAWVCLAPSLVINPVLLGIGVILPAGTWQLLVVSALLLHIAAASGDIALVNLLWRERASGGLITYDDLSAGETYFFRAQVF